MPNRPPPGPCGCPGSRSRRSAQSRARWPSPRWAARRSRISDRSLLPRPALPGAAPIHSGGKAVSSLTLTENEIAALCTAGASAPSGANAQPWQVTVAGNQLLVELHPERGHGGFIDVGGDGPLVGLGGLAQRGGVHAPAIGP